MKTPFLGDAQANLNIRYTPKAEIPPAHTGILCSDDTWELVEWTQRLAPAGKRIRLLGDPDYLSVFVNDCISLHSKTRGPRHPELFRYRSWDQLASAHAHRRAFTLVQKMLDKGYSQKDWQRASLAFDREGEAQYTLGLAADARNLEFSTVMLSPDIVSEVKASTSPATKARLYIAITRAREQLILPESLRGWVEEVSGQ